MSVEAAQRAEENLAAHPEIRLYLNDLRHLLKLRSQRRGRELSLERSRLRERLAQRLGVGDAVRQRAIGGLRQRNAAVERQQISEGAQAGLRRRRAVKAGQLHGLARSQRALLSLYPDALQRVSRHGQKSG